MHILIFGAGVIGSLYAARLQDSGQHITVLARGQRASDLREHGIVIQDAFSGQQSVTRVEVVEALGPDDAYDWIAVMVRKNQLESVLPVLAQHRGTPNILFMTNNASGPDALIAAVGRERVVLGFTGAGGERRGSLVRSTVLSGESQPTAVGELDGRETQRVRDIAAAFSAAGFPAVIQPQMDAWLKTHVAVVSPVANAIYMAGGDNYRLARSREGLCVLRQALLEGLQALHKLSVPITPSNLLFLEKESEEEVLKYLYDLFNSPRAELTLAHHANSARDEAAQLDAELRGLARAAQSPTPSLDYLATFIDPAVPPAIQ